MFCALNVDCLSRRYTTRKYNRTSVIQKVQCDITQKGYEKKRAKLLAPFVPQTQNVDVSIQLTPGLSSEPTSSPNAVPVAAPRQHRAHRSGGTRDDRYRSDIHTEAVQAALARHKEEKMALPMPTKRRSAFAQSSAENCTPPDTSSASEDEGSLRRRQAAISAMLAQNLQSPEYWINRSVQSSSTSSSASSTLSHGDGKTQNHSQGQTSILADVLAHTRIESSSVPPDVTSTVPQDRNSRADLPPNITVRGMSRGQSRSSMMDTAAGVPAHSRVSTKIQQLLNTLKRPKRPPLSEFFLDDFEEIVEGWPRLKWVVTDTKYLTKPSKDWQPHIPTANTDTAYIEYKASKEGTVMGVAVSKISMLTHCQALTQACNYCEGETLVNVLDFKKDSGLWHGVLTSVMNRIHTISVSYSVMKACPLSWVQRVHVHKARVAMVKCRDLHWAMMAHRDQKDTNLSSLRMLIVADGANPWSVSSCDAFLNVFQSHGLKPEMICPCASSPEAMTVAIRRPGAQGTPLPARAILSMAGLSHGVIRVNTEDKNSALTVQDVGHVMPGDEIGEIVLNSRVGGTMYYGLPGVTKNTFEVIPINSGGTPIGDVPFTRTGLLGFVGPGSLVFVVGKIEGLLSVSGRRHNADDLVATALAVEPVKTVYRGRIAVFSVTVFYDERVVIVAEQRPDANEEDSFQWMSRVLQHQFLSEALQWRAQTDPDHVLYMLLNAKGVAVSTATCSQLHKRAEKITAALLERGGINTGDNVVLLYPPGIDLIASFYGCLYAGCIPVTVRPPHPQNLAATLPTVRMIIDVSKAACILTTQTLMKILRSKEAAGCVNVKTWPNIIDTAEERPRLALTQSFSRLFKDLGLSPRAVSTAFGARVNLAICLQGTAGPDPSTVYVDMKSLRHDRVRLVERGAPQSLPLMESGTILPGVRVIIVNPETRGPLGDSHLGEIWVNSPHNASGYYTICGEESLQADHFNTRLSFGDTETLWARTGYLGFVRRTELLDASGDRHDALFVVGSLDETLELRGLRYHPIDIETSVSRAHRSIAESAVFTWTNLLVVVVELSGSEQEALDLVPLVTNVVLKEHHLIVGVVVIVDPGVIPINSRGEKQRMHLRDSFLADQLDPIYVAYNM
ncbi:hypothetical protein cypCar_00003249 [Cyprinus carpio]|nr:hypothetical protein cypCar_00003249 [Cyprinus carpio]